MNQPQAAAGAESPEFEVWTTERTAKFLNIAVRTLQGWRAAGTLPPDCRPVVVPGVRRLRWPAAAIRRFAAGKTQPEGSRHDHE